MATADEHVRLYGQIRKIFLSRYFAVGNYFRNDFFQEGAKPELDRAAFLAADPQERQRLLWRQTADRDNPWLFGAQLITALATEARLGLPGAEPLLDRAIRSCEELFATAFAGLPVRWDPVTSDKWWDPPVGGARVARDFLVRDNGLGYVYDVRPRDPRHFPIISRDIGERFMSSRLLTRYQENRGRYLETYRFHEASPEEIIGAIAAYVAAAEGTRVGSLVPIARNRLQNILTYLAEHAFLMVQPNGGLSARGPGAGLPAMEWPFRRAIERACGGVDLSVIATASIQDGLASAGLWPLFEGPTTRAMAVMWAAAPALFGLLVALQTGAITSLTGFPLPPNVLAEVEMLGNAVGGLANLSPYLDLNPGQLGFAAGLYLARDGFDVSREDAQSDITVASLLTSLATRERYWTFVQETRLKPRGAPWATGWVPFLGLLTIGDADSGASDLYWTWVTDRRAANIDQFTSTDLPYVGYSTSCFASAVALMHRSAVDWSETDNAAEESTLLSKLDERYTDFTADGGPWLLDDKEIRCALDYLVGVALTWRYREARGLVGRSVSTTNLPALPAPAVSWPAPGVPRVIVNELSDVVPVEAIQGTAAPVFNADEEAELFLPTSPRRPSVPALSLTFPTTDDVVFQDEFDVGPGAEVATGAVLQWGDVLEIEADGTLTVGGAALGPDGIDAPLWDARYPLHGGLDGGAREHALLARVNNFVTVGRRVRFRWLYPEETFLYLRLNQFRRDGEGAFHAVVMVRGGKRALSQYLQVDCITRMTPPPVEERPPGWKPSRRIVGIGGTHRDDTPWRKTLEEAWNDQAAGKVFFVRASGTVAAELNITQSADGTYSVRTWRDALSRNNLSRLPICP